MQHWLFLTSAIVFEVGGTVCMKLSTGFTRLAPSILMFVLYFASFAALAMALKRLDVSTVYAVWSGLGTVFISVIGILYFSEPAYLIKLAGIGLVIAGVAMIHLSGVIH